MSTITICLDKSMHVLLYPDSVSINLYFRTYHIARNFVNLNFQKILFNEYFGKIFMKFLVIFSFFATGLKIFKPPFCKKIQKIPEVSKISENNILRKFPAIWYFCTLLQVTYICLLTLDRFPMMHFVNKATFIITFKAFRTF